MEFTVRRIGPESIAEIDDWVQHKFLPSMPLMCAFGVDVYGKTASPHGPTPGSTVVYLQAVDSQGTVLGIAILKDSVKFGSNDNNSPEWNKIVDFMNFAEEDAKLHDLPGRTIELLVLSVAEESRGRGVARRLVLEAEDVAKEAKFDSIVVCCASEFAAKAARSAGWREHYRLAYKDYPKRSGTGVQLVPTPPHNHFYIYVKDFNHKR
ncbi:uncharacterized protein LOC128995706 [Macrosteles quadrilineatus]|uniref:uncharacterized protein LOC128995706 n=1 Tax=Macrosteles quadrilineatus TaxID=74068 RepID=UPI0023E1ED0F|nr:uncharacterized protein LOC128995706 [Macrosteles quadrilineatus]